MSSAGKVMLLLVSLIVLLMGGALSLIWAFSPSYDGDPSGYNLRVVVTSVEFDPDKAVYITGSPREALSIKQRTFYANEYEMRDSGLLLLKKGWAEWERTGKRSYRLNATSLDWVYRGLSSDSHEDVTIFRQSDGKRVFNSTEHLQRTYDVSY